MQTKPPVKDKLCKYCQQKIDIDAKVCHHCERDQRFLNQHFTSSITFVMVAIAISQAAMGWLQYKESKTKRIEAEDVLKEAGRVLTASKHVFSIASSNSTEIKNKATYVLSQATYESKKTIDKSINVNNIALKHAQESKVMIDNAEKGIKRTVITVNKQLNDSNERINRTEKEFDNINKNIQTVKVETTSQLGILKNRNELMVLADKAISLGDRRAFDKLVELCPIKERDNPETLPAMSEMIKVKAFYAAINRLGNVDIEYEKEPGKKLKNEQIPTEDLINALLMSQDWTTRGKAAQMLSDRKEKRTIEALLKAINHDTRLDVVKVSIESFNKLTSTKNIDVIDPYPINEWLKENKDKLEKDFK